MHKLAIFVEGQTEQIFVEKLVRYLGIRQIALRIDDLGNLVNTIQHFFQRPS
jgi:hypothetical protein